MTRAAIARAFALLGLGALMALFVYWVRMPQNLLWANNGYAMAMNGTWGFWESAIAIDRCLLVLCAVGARGVCHWVGCLLVRTCVVVVSQRLDIGGRR